MANDADDLLKAEQAVQDVLKELQALKRQVGGYETAKQSLEDIRQTLNGLIEKTSALAEQTHTATTALGKIGTPEILARADALKQALGQLAADAPKQADRVRKIASAGLIVSAVSLLGIVAILVKLFAILGKQAVTDGERQREISGAEHEDRLEAAGHEHDRRQAIGREADRVQRLNQEAAQAKDAEQQQVLLSA